MVQLSEHFRSDDRSRYSEWLRNQRWHIKARKDHQRREHIADNTEDNLFASGVETVVATSIQIAQFQERLDSYQEATTIALMENRVALEQIEKLLIESQERLDMLLSRAYVMPDGRRVFKSEDGSFAIDEHGEDVSPDEIDFELLPEYPSAESFLDERKIQEDLTGGKDKLLRERDDLFDFRDKLDRAEGELGKDGLSEDGLNDLEKDLLDAAPPSVMKKISGLVPEDAPKMVGSFNSKVVPTSSDDIDFTKELEAPKM